MPDKANIKTDERLFMRVCASDNVSFVVPVPKKEVESITYESLVSKIREKYVETCNVYSTAAPGMPQVKSKDVEVMLLRNFDGAHVGPEVRFHEMCNLDPNPSSPTVGVVLRKDVEADASALHWRFKGRELSFETGTSKLAVPTFVASDTQGHAAAVAVTSKAAPTPKSSKKRKAETPAPATAELPDAVKEKLERIFESGECSKGDIDDIALGRLAGLPVSKGIEVLGRFAGPELADAPNKSRHLMMVIRELGSAKDKGQAAPKQTDDQSAPASKKAKTDDAKTSKSKVQASVKSAPVAADEEGKKKEAKKEEEKKQKAKKEEEAQSAKELEESKRLEAEKKQKEDEKVQKEEEKKKAREEEKTKKEEKKMAEQKAKEEEKRKKEEEKKAKEEAKRLEATKKEEEKKAKEHAAGGCPIVPRILQSLF